MELALICAQQVIVLFLLIGVGTLAVKTGVLKLKHKQPLSNLLVNIVVPAMIVNSYQMEFSLEILRNLLAAACIWIYVAAAGFPPSAIRAAVMCTVLQTALASASEYVGLNALAAAGFGMLIWNPSWLGDISFQLSFVAVAAILAWGVPPCPPRR